MKKLTTRLRPERRALILSICSGCLSLTALTMGLVRCATANNYNNEEATACVVYTSTTTEVLACTTSVTSVSETAASTASMTTTVVTSAQTSSSKVTSSTTSMSTTTTVATETEPVTEVQTELVTEIQIEPITETYTEPAPAPQSYISDYEHTLLCNVVANEYGSDWVSTYDKACVVATVMNRVADPNFPSTIEGVLTQPYQFSGYYCSYSYYSTVTQSCIDAVDYYFAHQSEFPYYLYFDGNHYAADGSGPYNYFR